MKKIVIYFDKLVIICNNWRKSKKGEGHMNNIILIGMPGVGKSTIGVMLAKVLGYNFIDTDILIQEKTEMLLSQIINEKGIDNFIQIENNINSNLKVEKTVIATGGSAIYGDEAMDNFKKIGKIIYLKQDIEVINKRLDNIDGRGIVFRKNQTLKELYNERTLLYEKYADIIVEEGDLSIDETLQLLLNKIKKSRKI